MNLLEQMLQAAGGGISQHDALRETMQKIALAGLHRAEFFKHAAFYGGTCLKIFYDLPRFSEDLDFSLLAPQSNFSFEPFFTAIKNEFQSVGLEIEISERKKTKETAIVSAFLKETVKMHDLQLKQNKALKIKLEVDTNPPLGFTTEEKLILLPYSFYVKCFSLSDLFAGKMHAVLFRQWKTRVKGRDWFDFEWYIKRGTKLNLSHLELRARQSRHWQGSLSIQKIKELLQEKIKSLDFNLVKRDVEPFLLKTDTLDIWSRQYFLDLLDLLQFT